MSQRSVPERYVTLCLQVGEHLEGLVDAYIGPPALKEEATTGGPRDPVALREEALSLLDEVPGAGLEEERVRWLTAQLRAVECLAARLAGEEMAWSDEVERCFGVRPQHVDEDVFRASHDKLDDALPGSGDLATRYNRWRDSGDVGGDAVAGAVEVFARELRRRTAALVELPAGEEVEWRTVTGVPWQAYNWYRGDLDSLVEINLDLPFSVADLVDVVAHESYPGHHTERACKERLLYRDGSRLETAVMLLSAPEAVVAEGIATNALEAAAGDDGVAAVLAIAGDAGFDLDVEVAEVVHRESAQLFQAATNAARMLHEDGIGRAEAEAYVQEWGLYSPDRASKLVSFLADPASRTYATAYTDGKRLCSSFMDRSPDGFRRLLTEQLTVSTLVEAGA